jgi:ribosomal protein S27AE
MSETMICPKCGAIMNEHGEKVFDPRTESDVESVDRILGGVLHEMHSCPICGANTSRIASVQS